MLVISFRIVAIVLWQSTGDLFYLFNFLYIGTAIGIGTGFYSALPRKKKSLGRKLTWFLIGRVYACLPESPGIWEYADRRLLFLPAGWIFLWFRYPLYGSKNFYSIYLGVILSNAYACTSNISIILENGSFYLLGLNVAQVALLLAFLPLLVVLFFGIS